MSTILLIINKDMDDVKLLKYFTHIYIDNYQLFNDELDNIKSIFDNKLLIFVDEIKGFYIMTEPMLKVEFIRITRGNPRFKINI